MKQAIIKDYFLHGLSYKEILEFLEIFYAVTLSLRQLHRILRKQNLFRRCRKSNITEVTQAILQNLSGSSKSFGYCLMHQKLRADSFVVDRETVRILLKILDADGVELRSSHHLARRTYVSVGPNYLWHIDGYDKIKAYGFAIHGATDGFSRNVLWLRVASSNNNPQVIASYYMDCIRQLRLVPRAIRSGRGTENTIICGIQRFLRRNAEDLISDKNSFVYGSSTHNQRIECWWSILRRSRLNWWINFFKDISAENILDTSLTYIEFLRFCFLGILQEQLDGTRRLWNNHFVRKTRNTECPGGRLDVLLYTPSLVGGKDCRSPFVEADVNLALPYYEAPELFDDIGFCSPYHE